MKHLDRPTPVEQLLDAEDLEILAMDFEPGMDLEYAVDPDGIIEVVFTPPCDYCGLCVDVWDDGSGHRVICAACDERTWTPICSPEGEEAA